ncbi:MAG: hypothetical protein IH840_04840 [Candidatus Heimdallarchaeota archaeon]|nr:hypothetical protein [Candidatus Heimdallarchaeota archaeon]
MKTISTGKLTQLYCERCKKSYWFELHYVDFSKVENGILTKTFLHHDHVITCEVDSSGSIRSSRIIEFEFNFLRNLIEDSAQTFYYLNQQRGDPVIIDILDSKTQFSNFIRQIMIKIQEHAVQLTNNAEFSMVLKIDKTSTKLVSNQINMRLIKAEYFESIGLTGFGTRGVIFDFSSFEINSIPWDYLNNNYNWIIVLLPAKTKDQTVEHLNHSVQELNIPFFMEKLSNRSLENMFNFIFEILLP